VDLDGDFIDDVNAKIFLKTTDDDPLDVDAVWSDWKPFFVGEYKARGIKFQVRATSESREHNIVIKELSMVIDMPDRVVVPDSILTSGAGSYDVTYNGAFVEVPSVGITANDLNSGDYYRIINNTRTGFTITFYNSAGTPVSRSFSYMSKGYGRQVA
jgi:hypothetical protein